MDLKLAGKRVLITGASGGIGSAIAEGFAQEGARLRLTARKGDQLEHLAQALRAAHGAEVETYPADLRLSNQIETLAEAAGDIDILINNAGDIQGGSLEALPLENWKHSFDLKVFGYIGLSRLIYAGMKTRDGGVIINTIGVAGEKASFNYIAGSTGNAALMSFTQSLGSMSLFDNIRVVGVNPGAVLTERSRELKRLEAGRRWGDETRYAEIWRELPLGRPALPQEVADLVVFLASERAGYVSGSIHTIDGGGGTRPNGAPASAPEQEPS